MFSEILINRVFNEKFVVLININDYAYNYDNNKISIRLKT